MTLVAWLQASQGSREVASSSRPPLAALGGSRARLFGGLRGGLATQGGWGGGPQQSHRAPHNMAARRRPYWGQTTQPGQKEVPGPGGWWAGPSRPWRLVGGALRPPPLPSGIRTSQHWACSSLLCDMLQAYITSTRLGCSVPARPREELGPPEELSEFHTLVSRSFGTLQALHGQSA